MATANEARQIKDEIFDAPKEELLCVAGKPQLSRYLKHGKLKEGFVVLSDLAIYCKGELSLSRDRRHYEKQKTELRISLSDFQSVKYLNHHSSIWLFLGIFCVILGPALLMLNQFTSFAQNSSMNLTLDSMICELLAALCFLLYSIRSKKLLELIYTNGSIGLDLRYISEKEERLLIRFLRAFLNQLDNASK